MSSGFVAGGAPITLNLIIDGDSISMEPGVGGVQSYSKTFAASLANRVVRYQNFAVNGSIVPTGGSRLTQVEQAWDSTIAVNVLVTLFGINDLGSQSVSTFLTNYSTYLTNRKANMGAGLKRVVFTIGPCNAAATGSGGTLLNTLTDTANTTIRTWPGSFCDYVCDYRADATMGSIANTSNATYFQQQDIDEHPTQLGQDNLATLLAPILNTL